MILLLRRTSVDWRRCLSCTLQLRKESNCDSRIDHLLNARNLFSGLVKLEMEEVFIIVWTNGSVRGRCHMYRNGMVDRVVDNGSIAELVIAR